MAAPVVNPGSVIEIPNSSLQDPAGNPANPQALFTSGGHYLDFYLGGNAGQVVWGNGGPCYDSDNQLVHSPFGGGHGDMADNGHYNAALEAALAWAMLRQPTFVSNNRIIPHLNTTGTLPHFYTDTLGDFGPVNKIYPCSRHLYQGDIYMPVSSGGPGKIAVFGGSPWDANGSPAADEMWFVDPLTGDAQLQVSGVAGGLGFSGAWDPHLSRVLYHDHSNLYAYDPNQPDDGSSRLKILSPNEGDWGGGAQTATFHWHKRRYVIAGTLQGLNAADGSLVWYDLLSNPNFATMHIQAVTGLPRFKGGGENFEGPGILYDMIRRRLIVYQGYQTGSAPSGTQVAYEINDDVTPWVATPIIFTGASVPVSPTGSIWGGFFHDIPNDLYWLFPGQRNNAFAFKHPNQSRVYAMANKTFETPSMWQHGDGPMGTTSGVPHGSKLTRPIMDRNREQVVWSMGDMSTDGRFPSNTSPFTGAVLTDSGVNEVWRGVIAKAPAPVWEFIHSPFAPASAGVAPSRPLYCPFVNDPTGDTYIMVPSFLLPGSFGGLGTAFTSPSSPGPGATISLFQVGGGNLQAFPASGFLFFLVPGLTVGGQQEIMQYNNFQLTGPNAATFTLLARGAAGSTAQPSWPTSSIVIALNSGAYCTFNPNGPVAFYGAYVMNPVVQADGNAHWSYPAFPQPPSGYGGDGNNHASFDTLSPSLGGTRSLCRWTQTSLLQILNAGTNVWTEGRAGVEVINLQVAIPSGVSPGVGGLIIPTLSVADNTLFPPTGGIAMIGFEFDPLNIEVIRWSGKNVGANGLIVAERGAVASYLHADGTVTRAASPAAAHAQGQRFCTAETATNGMAVSKNRLPLDEYGRRFYFVINGGGINSYQFGPTEIPGTPFQPMLACIEIATNTVRIVAPLPSTYEWGIGLDDPGTLKMSIGEQHLEFDPLNRVVIMPNQVGQWGGPTVHWFEFHVDNPTRIYNLASDPGWEETAIPGGQSFYANGYVFDDFRNVMHGLGLGATNGGVYVNYRRYGGPSTASAAVLALFSLNPNTGLAGSSVTLLGSTFGATQGGSVVHFGPGAAVVTSWSDTSITITVPSLAAGTYNVSVTVGASTTNLLPFTIPSLAPSISSVTPASAPVNTGVVVAGTGFGASQGSSTITIGGITASATAWSNTSITVTVPGASSIGFAPIQVTTSQGSSNVQQFSVTGPPASIDLVFEGKIRDRVGKGNTQLAPDTLLDGVFTITLHGASGRTVTGLRLVMANSGGGLVGIWDTNSATQDWVMGVATTFDSAYLNDPVTMQVNFFVADGGTFAAFASDDLGQEFSSGNFAQLTVTFSDGSTASTTVTIGAPPPPPTPTLSQLTPTSGLVGSSVLLTGSLFGASQGSSQVKFGVIVATVTQWADGQITATVPSVAPGTYQVTVTTAAGASNALPYGVSSPPPPTPPSISSLTPSTGLSGTSVVIAGANFGASQGSSSITVGGVVASVTSWAATSITATVPTLPVGGVAVVVTTTNGASNGMTFTVAAQPPALTSITPSSGPTSTTVVLAGTNFGASQGGSSFTVGGQTAVVLAWGDTEITGQIPLLIPGAYTVRVITPAGTSNTQPFTVTGPTQPLPVLVNVSPSSAMPGQQITILGSNFGNSQGPGSSVTIGGQSVGVVAWTDSTIVVLLPHGIQVNTWDVTVTTSAGTSSPQRITVLTGEVRRAAGVPGRRHHHQQQSMNQKYGDHMVQTLARTIHAMTPPPKGSNTDAGGE